MSAEMCVCVSMCRCRPTKPCGYGTPGNRHPRRSGRKHRLQTLQNSLTLCSMSVNYSPSSSS